MDKSYANECDKLSEIAAKPYRKHWGRWFWDGLDRSLATWIEMADIGSLGAIAIPFKQLDESWIKQMKGYKWIGEQGLTDLKKAIKMLTTSKKKAEVARQ